MHALQFTGAEVQPALSGSAVALKQGGGGSGVWASHPSAIGYRRQGYTTGGSHGGSGSMTVTIAAVAPEFDSGMNSGTDQDEMERLNNFGQGAEENPTVAQSQPTSRAVQQTAVVGPGGAPLSVPGAPPAANLGNSMNVGGLTGYDLMMENAGLLDALGILPPGVGGGGTGGGSGRANRSSPYSSALTPPPSGLKSRSLGNGDGLTRGGGSQTPPPPVTSPTAPAEQAPGSQIDPGQPPGADDSATRDDEAKSLGDYYDGTVGLAADLMDEPPASGPAATVNYFAQIPRCMACHGTGVADGTAKVWQRPANYQFAIMQATGTGPPAERQNRSSMPCEAPRRGYGVGCASPAAVFSA